MKNMFKKVMALIMVAAVMIGGGVVLQPEEASAATNRGTYYKSLYHVGLGQWIDAQMTVSDDSSNIYVSLYHNDGSVSLEPYFDYNVSVQRYNGSYWYNVETKSVRVYDATSKHIQFSGYAYKGTGIRVVALETGYNGNITSNDWTR